MAGGAASWKVLESCQVRHRHPRLSATFRVGPTNAPRWNMTKPWFLLVTVWSSIASANPRVAALEPQLDRPPGDAAPIATATTPPSTFVSLGGAIGVGGAVDWLYGGTQVEGG